MRITPEMLQSEEGLGLLVYASVLTLKTLFGFKGRVTTVVASAMVLLAIVAFWDLDFHLTRSALRTDVLALFRGLLSWGLATGVDRARDMYKSIMAGGERK